MAAVGVEHGPQGRPEDATPQPFGARLPAALEGGLALVRELHDEGAQRGGPRDPEAPAPVNGLHTAPTAVSRCGLPGLLAL